MYALTNKIYEYALVIMLQRNISVAMKANQIFKNDNTEQTCLIYVYVQFVRQSAFYTIVEDERIRGSLLCAKAVNESGLFEYNF